jgi:hypothetical protein
LKKKYFWFLFYPWIFLFFSCSILIPYESYRTIKGDHCYIICDGEFSQEEYEEILSIADESFLIIKERTDLDINFPIAIYFDEYNFFNDSGFARHDGIFLNSEVIEYLDEDLLRNTIKHEMVHIFFGLYYGTTTSMFFSEGIAEYLSNDGVEPEESSSTKNDLLNWIELSYFDFAFARENYKDKVYEIYLLSYEFIFYWCETYGERSIYKLYPEITSENIIAKLEEYSEDSFENLYNDFLDFFGVQ